MKFLAKAASMEHLSALMVTLPIVRASILFAGFGVNYGQRRRHIKQLYKLSRIARRLQLKGDMMRNAEVVDERQLFQPCEPRDTTDQCSDVSPLRSADCRLYAATRHPLLTSRASYQVVAKEHAPLNLCEHFSLDSPEQLHLL